MMYLKPAEHSSLSLRSKTKQLRLCSLSSALYHNNHNLITVLLEDVSGCCTRPFFLQSIALLGFVFEGWVVF